MIRQNINLGLHTYICDLYKAEDDLKRSVQREFVMLRRYDITDDIVYDTDIYFVEKSIINDVVSNLEDNTKIVWPIPGNVGTEFNANYTEYNSNFSEYTFKKNGDDLHKLYREFTNTDGDKVEFREAEILCDKIRIYHPQTKVDLDYVIYIDNYINDIHFHYYCQKVSNLETYTEDEFRYGTNIYSEFVEFYIPNIEDIISKDVFFKEDMNTLSIYDSEFVNQYKNLITEINITHDQITAYEKTKDVISVNPIPVYTDDNGIKWHLSEFEQTEDDKKYNIVHKPVYHAIIRSRAFEDLVVNDPDYYGLTTGYESVISDVYYEDLLNKEGWEPITKQVILNSTKAKISESNEETYPNMPTYHEVDETKNTNTVLASSHLLTVPFMIKKISDTEGYEKIYLPEVQKAEPLSEEFVNQLPKDKKIIGYCGTLGRANALHNLVEVARMVKDSNPDLFFAIVGKGPEKDNLNALIKKYGLDNIRIYDAIPKPQVQSFLQLSSIIIIIIWSDSDLYKYGISPNKIFDYMYAGKPVLQSVRAGNDIPRDSGCGITCDTKPEEIAQTLKKMLALPQAERDEMGKKGHDYVMQNHTYEVLAKKFIEVINK